MSMRKMKELLVVVVSVCFLLAWLDCQASAAKRASHPIDQPASHDAPDADAFRVLPLPEPDTPEMTPYLQYQVSLAWHEDALRRARWSQIKTEADLQVLRKELRTSVLEMIGGLPTQVGADGFHVEKLVYQSLPGLYVTALVYVPDDGSATHPAVLVAAGHSPKGKIYYQELCQRLVKRGYLVLSWDPLGQGERSQFWDKDTKKSRYNLICAEHAVMGNLAYLAGTNLARWEVWDGMRAVDYLLSRSDVDGRRISLTGTSGGGFQAALLGALDERIQVIIPSCYITALPMRMANRIFVDPDSDPEQDLFGSLSKQVDHPGLLLLMYPRAVMVAAATLDFFPVQGTHKSYSEVREMYGRFGHGDAIALAETYNQHQFSLKNQEAALDFLDRWNAMPLRQGLPPVTDLDENLLHVTPGGQVLTDYADARPLPEYIAQYAAEHAALGRESVAGMYRRYQDPHISSWKVSQYRGAAPAGEVRWQSLGSESFGSAHIDRYLLHHDTYLAMPMLHIHSDEGRSRGAILWFSLEGKASQRDWPEMVKLLSSGYDVYSFDFRGLGETRMHYRARSPDDPSLAAGSADTAYSNPLSSVLADYVYNSLLTGRPYFLELLDDLLIAERFVREQEHTAHTTPKPITLAPKGDAHLLAMRFREIDSDSKLLSPTDPATLPNWSALVRDRQERWPIAFLLPGGALIP
jgi:cephalosporin-C deacetylase-like acetyl esterase